MIRTFRLHLALLVLPMMLLPCSSNAQGRSHGYVSLGAGATDIDWGVDWLIPTTPIGIGAEMGVENLLTGECEQARRSTFGDQEIFHDYDGSRALLYCSLGRRGLVMRKRWNEPIAHRPNAGPCCAARTGGRGTALWSGIGRWCCPVSRGIAG